MATSGYFPVILLLVLEHVFNTGAIRCYKCVFAQYIYESDASLCQEFDYSDKFIVDCPFSTLCMKKNTHTILSNEQINGTDRDCALQKLNTQRIRNGKWQPEIDIEEPYTEGCKVNEDKGLRTAFIEHCYCRGDLCNAGSIPRSLFITLLILLAVQFLL